MFVTLQVVYTTKLDELTHWHIPPLHDVVHTEINHAFGKHGGVAEGVGVGVGVGVIVGNGGSHGLPNSSVALGQSNAKLL